MSNDGRKVYFAECIGPLGPIGAYKIGCSFGWRDRLKQIGSGLPFSLELRAAVSGDTVLEKICHIAFKDDCISGEYFRATDRVVKAAAFAAEKGRVFPLIEDLGEQTVPDGAVPAFMGFHGVSLGEVCELLGFAESQYERRLANVKYRSRNIVAATAVIANRRGQYVRWPTDALRGLLGEVNHKIAKAKVATPTPSGEIAA